MRDWQAFVRTRLPLPELEAGRQRRIVRELADQLEDYYRDALAAGFSEAEADQEARRQVSDWEAFACRIRIADNPHLQLQWDRWTEGLADSAHARKGRWRMFADLLQDFRYALRQLSRNRAFGAVAVATLALGVGANTAVFSLLDAVLLKTLPVPQPERLALLDWIAGRNIGMIRSLDGSYQTNPEGQGWSTSFPVPFFRRLESEAGTLESTFAFAELDRLNVRIQGDTHIASAQEVSGGYFAGLGVKPRIGRLLTEDDDRNDAEPAVVISFRYWRRRLGEDPLVIGRTVFLNGSPFTIVGVTPAGFDGALQVGDSPDISAALAMDERLQTEKGRLTDPSNWWVRVFGRLKPGVTFDQAQTDLSSLFDGFIAGQVPRDSDWDLPSLRVHSGSQGLTDLREQYSETLFLLQAGVALLLMIACANVAALLLARSDARRREKALRIALGAGRFRLLRQIAVESTLLAGMGGGLGWIFAIWGKGWVGAALPGSGIRQPPEAVLDWRVFWFTLGIVVAAATLASLVPALRWLGGDTAAALKESPKVGARSSRVGAAVLVAQIALLAVLLTGAGLLARTLENLYRVDYGFDADHLLLGRVDPTLNGYKDDRLVDLYGQILERLRALPGVEGACLVRFPLVSGRIWYSGVAVPGHEPPQGERAGVFVNLTGEEFFQTMRIPLLAGRSLSSGDTQSSPPVAVISRAMADRYFREPAPIGKHFTFRGREVEVVGVAPDTALDSLRSEIRPTIHIPYRQYAGVLGASFLAVRAVGDPESLIPPVREAIRSIEPNLPLFEIKTQKEQLAESTRSEARLAGLATTFGGLALLLVCVGLSGLLSYEVGRRWREIGIRIALGAQTSHVRWLVFGRAFFLMVAGLTFGLAAAVVLARYLENVLFGVPSTDWVTFCGVVAVLLLTATIACWVPSRRATQVDPITALRYE